MSDGSYGIDIDNAHPRAIELIPEEFFWNCVDELAPFGSDEGDMALSEYRDWKKENKKQPTIECLKWTIESVGEMDFDDYNETLLSKEKIQRQVEDEDFDDRQFIFTLDISVIATGFGQLVDDGIIDKENKPVIRIALDRQILWSQLQEDWQHAEQYIANLNILKEALEKA